MQNPFTKHPHSINETYFRHLYCAMSFGLYCLIASLAVMTHAIFPFVFEHTASNIIKKLNERMQKRINSSNSI